MKQFDRKAVMIDILVSFTITAGLIGLFFFLVYKPLLNWNPVTPLVSIEVVDTIYFDVNSTIVKLEAYKVIENIAKYNAGKIFIIGGADSSGNMLVNWKLAQNRALVTREMMIHLGIRDSIFSGGSGDYRPLVPNTTFQNKQINRYTLIKWRKLQ